ncbi:hypothetical protein CR513_09343, partial [Mucuna pruriens]
MAQMFQILTQTNSTITALANQSAAGHAQVGYTTCLPPHNTRDPPYGMPYVTNAANNDEAGPHVQQDQGDEHHVSRNTIPHRSHRQVPLSKEKWQSLDERLRAIEGGNIYELEAVDLCLIPDVGLLTDFKTLEFDKYKGSSYPRVHLAMYCCMMVAYIYDDKVLIHYFQDNLTRTALSWYVSLERGCIKKWRDLVEAFLKQYKYNEDMAPDCSRLQNMVKKEQEGFKEYAQRWRELEVQVQPPITEREMVMMFIDTLLSLYYDRIVKNIASNFIDLVVVGERIELGI